MSSKTQKPHAASGAVPETGSLRLPIIVTRRKKRVAVDQYMARTLLREIPLRRPHKGEIIALPDKLPSMVERRAGNQFHCDVCNAHCTSYTVLREHQAGAAHRSNVIVRAMTSHRFAFF